MIHVTTPQSLCITTVCGFTDGSYMINIHGFMHFFPIFVILIKMIIKVLS